MRKFIVTVIIILVAFFLFYFIYAYIKPVEETHKTIEKHLTKVKVSQAIANNQTCSNQKHYFGKIQYSQSIKATSGMQGNLVPKIPFLIDRSIRKGQLIATISNPQITQQYQSKLSSYQSLLNSITPVVSTDYPQLKTEWAAFASSFQGDTLPTLPKFQDERFLAYLATRNVNAALFDLKSLKSNLSKLNVYSPVSGTISAIYRIGGVLVRPGEPILEIQSNGITEIKVPIAQEDIAYLSKKEYTFKSQNTTYTATFNRSAHHYNRDNFMIDCFFSLKSNQPAFNGEIVDLYLSIPICEDCIQIPSTAVHNGNQVYIIKDKIIKPKQVEVISQNPEFAYISGLADGTAFVNEYMLFKYEGYQIEE